MATLDLSSNAVIDALLRDFLDHALTLREIADKYAITLLEAARIFESPEFQAHLTAALTAIHKRAKAIALATATSIVHSQSLAFDECIAIAKSAPLDAEDAAAAPDSKQAALRSRAREQSRKAANLLIRFVRTPLHSIAATLDDVTSNQSSEVQDHAATAMTEKQPRRAAA